MVHATTESTSPAQPLSARLPELPPASARLSRLVFDERFAAGLGTAMDGLQLTPGAAPVDCTLHSVQLGSDSGTIELLVDANDHPALCMSASADVDHRLRELAAVALLDPLVDTLRQLGLAGAHARAITPLAQEPGEAVPAGWCTARTAHGQTLSFTARQLPQDCGQALRTALDALPLASRWRQRLALPGLVRLAWRVVSLPVLQSLLPGDVLLTSCPAQLAEGWPAHVSFGAAMGRRLRLSCQLTEHALTTIGDPQMSNETDETDILADEAAPEAAPVSLGEMDIPLRFELETLPVPLADLEAIRPGYVIELATPLHAATIRLVAWGQTLGHGELVAVGDKLGVRITRLVSRDEQQPTH